MHRIKSIDGLRAISILFVLIGHGVHTIYEHYSNYYITMLGEMGVSFFLCHQWVFDYQTLIDRSTEKWQDQFA